MSVTKRLFVGLTLAASLNVFAGEPPLYKPSSRSPAAIDISSSEYGARRLAPTALDIGDEVPDFVLPKYPNGTYSLSAANKPVAIVFYRGHW